MSFLHDFWVRGVISSVQSGKKIDSDVEIEKDRTTGEKICREKEKNQPLVTRTPKIMIKLGKNEVKKFRKKAQN